MQVSKEDLGDRWPLTVGTGYVDCESGALIFRYHGTSYALNISATEKGTKELNQSGGVRLAP